MKNDPPALEPLAARLRTTEPTLPGSTFTAAVMANLPRADALATWQKNTIILAATALGSAVVAWQLPSTNAAGLLMAATTDWVVLLGTAVVVTYSAAVAAVWTARKI